MTDAATLCPVCDRDTPANPQECEFRRFWDDRSVFRAYSQEEIADDEKELNAARATMRGRLEGLPVTYALALANGSPDVTTFPLFERGSVGPWAARRVRVEAAPGVTEILLPVLAWTDADPHTWDLVRLARVAAADDRSAEIRVELIASGEIHIAGRGVESCDGGPSWPQIRDGITGSDGTAPPPTDVVCIVDRTGTPEEFAERTGIVRDLLGLVEKFGDRFHVALIECCDHRYPLVVDDPCVLVHPLRAVNEARATLTRWQPLAARNDLGAPIEDALAALETLQWRDGTRRILFTLGARAPHPPRQESEPWLNCCPHRHDWEPLLTDAKENHDLRCVAVRWPRAESELMRLALPREAAWDALGDDTLLDHPADVSTSVLAGLLGIDTPAAVPPVHATSLAGAG